VKFWLNHVIKLVN